MGCWDNVGFLAAQCLNDEPYVALDEPYVAEDRIFSCGSIEAANQMTPRKNEFRHDHHPQNLSNFQGMLVHFTV